jgi:hypothetical protein
MINKTHIAQYNQGLYLSRIVSTAVCLWWPEIQQHFAALNTYLAGQACTSGFYGFFDLNGTTCHKFIADSLSCGLLV